MGLDMYLLRKVYLSSWRNTNLQLSLTQGDVKIPINPKKVTSLLEEVGYWRKANAIHRWFVNNVQNGVDDCGEYYVTDNNLLDLRDLCSKVLEEPHLAKDLLPTQSGFFFGATEYDDGYFDDLKQTIEICQQALDLLESDRQTQISTFYYNSSW